VLLGQALVPVPGAATSKAASKAAAAAGGGGKKGGGGGGGGGGADEAGNLSTHALAPQLGWYTFASATAMDSKPWWPPGVNASGVPSTRGGGGGGNSGRRMHGGRHTGGAAGVRVSWRAVPLSAGGRAEDKGSLLPQEARAAPSSTSRFVGMVNKGLGKLGAAPARGGGAASGSGGGGGGASDFSAPVPDFARQPSFLAQVRLGTPH
jgi:hypothetical protein